MRRGRVDNKAAIVTGAGSTPGPGSGTGKATAVALAREGARVLLVDIRPERAEETLDGHRRARVGLGRCVRRRCDDSGRAARPGPRLRSTPLGPWTFSSTTSGVASFSDCRRLASRKRSGTEPWTSASVSTFLSSKYAVPVMIEHGGGAQSSNVSSISALRGDGHSRILRQRKAAYRALTVDMAYSHGRQGIRVNSIAPGHNTTPPAPIRSSVKAHRRTTPYKLPRRIRPARQPRAAGWDVAWAAVFLASDEARWITGATLARRLGRAQRHPADDGRPSPVGRSSVVCRSGANLGKGR